MSSNTAALLTLARRRLSLSAHTPREIIVPLLTPILFAIVIAPALATTMGAHDNNAYMTFVAIGTVGLLVPLSCMFAGIGIIVDRETGARRELLAAPVPRQLIVGGNLLVALGVSALQLIALLVTARLRGAEFTASAGGIAWFTGVALLFSIAMYGLAEILANRMKRQEEYVGAVPAIAILPWFFAGSLFPLTALPAGLAAFAKVIPLTHVLALLRYGLVDPGGKGLHDIWGMSDTTTMALLSLLVVAVFAGLVTAVALRVFRRAAVG
jgi:lipooligosaccharide transport system permease protein